MDDLDLLEFAGQLKEWHQGKLTNLENVIDNVKAGTILKVGPEGEKIELTSENAKWFKAGLQIALSEFEKLPFELTVNGEEVGS